uniref:Putative secreted protein n=1 Tax=Xenopsylla cheopis TaxID=163159 RepID=A0A6M2E042_XENCH
MVKNWIKSIFCQLLVLLQVSCHQFEAHMNLFLLQVENVSLKVLVVKLHLKKLKKKWNNNLECKELHTSRKEHWR